MAGGSLDFSLTIPGHGVRVLLVDSIDHVLGLVGVVVLLLVTHLGLVQLGLVNLHLVHLLVAVDGLVGVVGGCCLLVVASRL